MVLAILVMITALSISAVAIYYSIAGLVAIFAAAAIPIMIMGGVLEVGKLVTAVWLHRYWKQAVWWLKTYLTIAVVVLMLITSMGIFGFLSKAHIEQTSASEESIAKIETIESETARLNSIIERAETKIKQLESSGTGADTNIQNQIDKEQERIDKAFERIQPAIEEQNAIIASVTKLFQDELDKIDADIETLQGYIDAGEVKKAQQMIGASADGVFGKKTADKIGEWQKAKQAERSEWLTKIQDAANSPTVKAARDEIQRLRKSAEDQVANSQALIERLRTQLANSDNADEIQKSIDEQNDRIRTASNEIEKLTDEKITLQAEYRKLEAEVGPIKYIAEFVYGEQADKNMLEEAVRWVIIVIIFVFDPLAVLLLIASQYTFEFSKRRDDSGERLRREYEQLRAQRIIDNPGYNIDDPKEDTDENSREEAGEEESQDAETLRTRQDEESIQRETSNDSVVATENQGEVDVTELTTTTDDDLGDSISKDNIAKSYAPDDRMEQSEVQTDEQGSKVVEKKDSESPDVLSDIEQWNNWVQAAEAEVAKEEMQARIQRIQEQEDDPDITEKKRLWKIENPGEKVKTQKNLYVRGMISKLPWEDFESELRAKPDLTEVIEPEGYVQNSEQNEKSVWNRIKRDSE